MIAIWCMRFDLECFTLRTFQSFRFRIHTYPLSGSMAVPSHRGQYFVPFSINAAPSHAVHFSGVFSVFLFAIRFEINLKTLSTFIMYICFQAVPVDNYFGKGTEERFAGSGTCAVVAGALSFCCAILIACTSCE